MPQIVNMPGFPICQVVQYNERRLVLEQATLIFEMELFFQFGIPFPTKIKHALF